MLSKQSVIVVRDQNVLSSSVEEQAVLLNLEKGSYYTLDAVGADIWQMLHEPITVSEIITRLLQDYDITPAQVENDVLELLADLGREGLILVDGKPLDAKVSRQEDQASQRGKGTVPDSEAKPKRGGFLSRFTKRDVHR
jgi:hypothetical protein